MGNGAWRAIVHEAAKSRTQLSEWALCESESHSVVSSSLGFQGLWPARLLCPWDFPVRNTGVGCHSLLQGIFPTQKSNPGLPAWQADSLPSEPLRKRQKIIENFLNVELQRVLKIMLPNMCFHKIINSLGH